MDIEEDINILENLKKYLNLLIYEGTHKIIYNDLDWDEKTIDCINAIEHILAEREEDKKKIEELEDENRIQRHQIMAAYDNGYIPKQKVKDKIEENNKLIEKCKDELETYKLSNRRLREKLDSQIDNRTLENIIKFAITNHVGNLKAGIMIDAVAIDKMKDLRLLIDRDNECGRAYIIRVIY